MSPASLYVILIHRISIFSRYLTNVSYLSVGENDLTQLPDEIGIKLNSTLKAVYLKALNRKITGTYCYISSVIISLTG